MEIQEIKLNLPKQISLRYIAEITPRPIASHINIIITIIIFNKIILNTTKLF